MNAIVYGEPEDRKRIIGSEPWAARRGKYRKSLRRKSGRRLDYSVRWAE